MKVMVLMLKKWTIASWNVTWQQLSHNLANYNGSISF